MACVSKPFITLNSKNKNITARQLQKITKKIWKSKTDFGQRQQFEDKNLKPNSNCKEKVGGQTAKS